MADDTYPEELYVDEVDVYDYDEGIYGELQELLEWEREQDDANEWYWEGEQPEANDEGDNWFWGRE